MKKMCKLILSLGLGLSMISLPLSFATVQPSAGGSAFTDVPADYYAADAIKTMSGLGVITGYPNGEFKPAEPVNRAEFAVMMVKTLKLNVDGQVTSSFSDMQSDAWAIPYVESAKSYLTGYKTSAGLLFKPSEASVREDMAVALVKALNKPVSGEVDLNQFSDVDQISKELQGYVAAAVQNKLMAGSKVGDKLMFKPQDTLTRAEAASLLMNVIKEEKITFDDSEIRGNKVVVGDLNDQKVEDDEVVKDDAVEKDKFQEKEKSSVAMASALKVTVQKDGSLLLKWTKANSSGFNGYKVVASKTDATPKYPDNGYFMYITDINKTSVTIVPGDGYNSGDVGSFESGHSYYFSMTTLYEQGNKSGNVVRVTMP